MTDSPWDNFEVRVAFSSKDDVTVTNLGSLPAQNHARHNQIWFILKLPIKSISFFLCYFIFFLSNLVHYLRLLFLCVHSFARESHIAQDGLELTIQQKKTLNSWFFCFCVLHGKITGVHHHACMLTLINCSCACFLFIHLEYWRQSSQAWWLWYQEMLGLHLYYIAKWCTVCCFALYILTSAMKEWKCRTLSDS